MTISSYPFCAAQCSDEYCEEEVVMGQGSRWKAEAVFKPEAVWREELNRIARNDRSVECLFWAEQGVGDERLGELGRALQENTVVHTVFLQYNTFSSEGTGLALLRQALDRKGAAPVCQLYLHGSFRDYNSQLQDPQSHLSMLFRRVRANGLEAIRSRAWTAVFWPLQGLCSTDPDITSLLEALPNSSLTQLNLASNSLEDSTALALAAALDENPGLHNVDLNGNPQLSMAASAQPAVISRVTVAPAAAGSTLPLASATRSASLLTARELGSGTIPPITESVVSQAVSDGSSRPCPSPSIVRRAVRTASP